jgi:hypothetical protein
MSAHALVPAWTPHSVGQPQAVPAGRYWDAVRAPQQLAEPVLDLLDGLNGAVIEDRWFERIYWLVAPGALDGWQAPDGVTVCGTSWFVTVPPTYAIERHPVAWRVPPAPGRYLTDAGLLRDALGATV